MTTWEPAVYNRFAAERERPFWDLVRMLGPVEQPSVVDLGCGDGRLTALLHRHLSASRTLGVDSSDSMLAASAAHAVGGVSFERGDIARWPAAGDGGIDPGGTADIVLANASLQWVPDHRSVLARWTSALRGSGQLAVQVPANSDHPSHLLLHEVGVDLLGENSPPDVVTANVLAPETYAELLHDLGFARQHVRLQVYPHELSSPAELVEWTRGTALTRFRSRLDDATYEDLVETYRRRLLDELGERSPYCYYFKRILMWGRTPHRADQDG